MVTTEDLTTPPPACPGDGPAESPLVRHLFAPVDIAPLVFFRIAFGFLMSLELGYSLYLVLQPDWPEYKLHFTYFGFSWVQAPPGFWMPVFLGVVLLGALGVTLGFFYRLSAALLAFGFTWFFLIDQSDYLNHFYFVCLLAFIAIFLPAHRAFSLDARRQPALRASVAPVWTLRLIQVQMALVYVFGGIAKINHDWLRGEPMRTWLHVGRVADRVPDFFRNEFSVYLFSYGGLAFDLLIVPLLLWKRTRGLALALAIIFHLSNSYLFNIGIFPYLSIALTLLFVPPGWHRKILRLGPRTDATSAPWPHNPLVPIILGLYLTVQVLLPFRHWLYAGNVHWTEEGHRFAWHMMLRSNTGQAYYIVEDRRSATLWRIHPREHLSPRQYLKMATHPEMLLQFAHFIRDQWNHPDIAIHVVSNVSLNGRPRALLVDPETNLAEIQYGFGAAPWILPPENNHPVPGRFRLARTAPGFPGI